MTIKDVLRKYMDSASMIIRVYKSEDYGNENEAEPIYPVGYLWELPQMMCLGEYQNLMKLKDLAVIVTWQFTFIYDDRILIFFAEI